MKAELDPIVHFLRGGAGNFIYRKIHGKTIVSPKPVRDGVALSTAQAEHRARFNKAVAYGKSAMANDQVRPLYNEIAKAKDIPVFAAIMGDYFNTPTIQEVNPFGYGGNIGDMIIIHATDDCGVVKVHVSISAPDGSPIEHGEAIQTTAGSGEWIYTATVQGQPLVKIQVVAVDRPGGTAVMNIDKTF